jgi:hypothetical protein
MAECSCDAAWRDSTYCKDVNIGDVLWQTEGAPLFSIVRFCRDHFDIVMVNVEVKGLGYKANKLEPDRAATSYKTLVQASEWAGWRQVILV